MSGAAPPELVLLRHEQVSGGPPALRPAAGRAACDVVAIVGDGLADGRVELAVHEVLANALEHGHLGAADVAIELTVHRVGDRAIVAVADHALGADVPRVGAVDDDPWAVRGRGLALVRASADEVVVEAQDDPPGTLVRLTWERRPI